MDKIVTRVLNKIKSRSTLGILKYKTTLYDSGEDKQAFLTHLQEELMDGALYVEKVKQIDEDNVVMITKLVSTLELIKDEDEMVHMCDIKEAIKAAGFYIDELPF